MVNDDLATTRDLIELDPHLTVRLLGQVVDLSDPGEVAQCLYDVREAKRQLDEVRQLLEDVLRLESSRQGTKTLHLEGLEARITGGTKPEYDLEQLEQMLREAGLPEQRLNELIVVTISRKLNQSVARQLRGANLAYAHALETCRTDVPAPWRVTVERERT